MNINSFFFFKFEIISLIILTLLNTVILIGAKLYSWQYSLDKKAVQHLNQQKLSQSNRIAKEVRMLQDHENLLSTFGKDSQSSNCKQKQLSQAVKNKRACLNYEIQTKTRFQQIFNQRNSYMVADKKQKGNRREETKKLKTETDIEDLNNKIRRSISGIAQIIGKSKNQVQQKASYDAVGLSSTKQLLSNINITLPTKTTNKSSYKQPKAFQSVAKQKSRSSRYAQRQKQNLSYINNGNTINTISPSYTNSSKGINYSVKYANVNTINNGVDRGSALGNRGNFSSNFSRENSINNQKYSHEMIIRNDTDKDRRESLKCGEYMRKDKSLRNSTKKKTNAFQTNQHYYDFSNSSNNNMFTNTNNQNDSENKIIKDSYSIDLNSQRHHDSISHHQPQDSSRLHTNDLNPAKFQTNAMNSVKEHSYQPRMSTKHRQSLGSRFNKKPHLSMGRGDNEDTLKKEFRQYDNFDTNSIQQPQSIQHNNQKANKKRPTISTQKHSTKPITSYSHNNQFLFQYQDSNSFGNNNNFNQQVEQQQKEEEKSPDFNKIQVPKKFSLNDIKKRLIVTEDKKQQHPLIAALMDQIELDFDLRHAKHMFSGIQQPFNTTRYDSKPTLSNQSSKWQLLNQELNNRGLFYNVETIKKIFLPSQQELDPFLSVTHPHDQLIYSLIYAYETAEIHWEQAVYKKWQHWDLRDIQLTIENIDRERKGYITVEDIAAFVSMQSGKEYKNRDVILIYKRVINGFSTKGQTNNFQSNTFHNTQAKLKFRSLIDSLIKNF